MQYAQNITVVCAVVIAGCSAETSRPPAAPSVVKSSESATSETRVVAKPKYVAGIFITAARKGEGGMKCSGDLGPTGKFGCGPEISLTELSWEFTEHRDKSDYYKFDWTLTSNGEPTNSKSLTIGFDGASETTVIDAEHYIVIRQGPLHPKTGAEANLPN